MIARLLALAAVLVAVPAAARIERQRLVARHDVRQTRIDPHAPVMLGNGSLGFTADITGLQTFPQAYAPQSPLLTMAQWAWHSFPNPQGWTARDGMVEVPVEGRGKQPYAWFRDFELLKTRPALAWLRENPHRFALGRVSLRLVKRDGTRATVSDLTAVDQRLDLWRGVLLSRFVFDGAPVAVETRVDARSDAVLVGVESPLVATGRVGVDIAYPGVGAKLNPDPSDWSAAASHRTEVLSHTTGRVTLRRTIDATTVHAAITVSGGRVARTGSHAFALTGTGRRLTAAVSFAPRPIAPRSYAAAVAAADEGWTDYWRRGGVVSFAGSTDPRASELERRVVLSQYLARINQSGSVPPQEEGLYTNSWNGKFHLEMVPWHAAHWASWQRPDLLRPMLEWYLGHLPKARARAASHRVAGAWWPKMAGPAGDESPSPINPFIMWQQPHPILLAELMRRAEPGRTTLARYGQLVDETATLLASWPLPGAAGRVQLGPPIVPVQENHDPLVTRDPAFEVAYWRWALETALRWRTARGLPPVAAWQRTLAALPPVPQAGGLYLPVAGLDTFWRDTTGRCSGDATGKGCLNRDHPSFLMAYGLIRSPGVDGATMRRTLAATKRSWDLRQTWGWDFPMIAMTAARLGDREGAVDWLFADQVNNRWGTTGMTPRVELHPGERGGPDGDGYRRIADTYFPSNGSLLLSVGMMAAGWDGSTGPAPGFPRRGWRVQVENISPVP